MSAAKKQFTDEDLAQYDWIHLQTEMNALRDETFREKSMRKFAENPLVPIGCLATAGALTFGLYSFYTGQRKMSQLMMRTRVLAQGFTVLAVVVGIGISASKTGAVPEKKHW